MVSQLTELLKKTEKQAQFWRYAAWTAPFVALGLIVTTNFLGNNELFNIVITGIIVTFIAVSTFWWWWAIDKIYQLVISFNKTDESFVKVVKELQGIREEIRKSNPPRK